MIDNYQFFSIIEIDFNGFISIIFHTDLEKNTIMTASTATLTKMLLRQVSKSFLITLS